MMYVIGAIKSPGNKMTRSSSNPKRRIETECALDKAQREDLVSKVQYTGSAHHKRFPGDYNFTPAVSPRPWKSVCDGRKIILKAEAENLLRDGILRGMFSKVPANGFPKYIWSVDGDGEVYEAKTNPYAPGQYHGYRLENEDPMRALVINTWKKRCLEV